MARLVRRAFLGKLKIKDLDVAEWQNYVSPDIPVERHTNLTQPSQLDQKLGERSTSEGTPQRWTSVEFDLCAIN
ncbi:hypothetical protein [Ruegeria atlantica]|uniref:hypothetical protein n=1 Tax=Ruegeria atlantica TaxID=81569 RepID=UPI00147F6673|nr:hypothetical protein [Ruegeria atlantica]